MFEPDSGLLGATLLATLRDPLTFTSDWTLKHYHLCTYFLSFILTSSKLVSSPYIL